MCERSLAGKANSRRPNFSDGGDDVSKHDSAARSTPCRADPGALGCECNGRCNGRCDGALSVARQQIAMVETRREAEERTAVSWLLLQAYRRSPGLPPSPAHLWP